MRWTVLSRGILFLFQYVVSVIVARLLVPAEFGLVAMVSAATGFGGVLIELGLGGALVQERELTREQLDSAFSLTVAVGFVATCVFVAAAPGLASFYGQPDAKNLARAASLGLLFSSVGTVPRAYMQRSLEIKRLALLDLGVATCGGLLSVALAWGGLGAWALVWPSLWISFGSSLLPLMAGGWRPTRARGSSLAWPLMRVGGWLVGFNAINYWARNADNVLIGKYLGEAELGVYARAYALMLLPLTLSVGVLAGPMVPALSAVRDDSSRAGRIFLKAIGVIFLGAAPVMMGLAAVAGPFVLLVYGSKWVGMVPILEVLAPAGALQAVMNPVGWIYVSQGRTDLMMRWAIGALGVVILAIALGIWAGSAISVAKAYLLANAFLFLPGLALPCRLLRIPIGDIVRTLKAPAIASVAMFGFVRTLTGIVGQAMSAAGTLTVGVIAGVVFYSAAIVLLQPIQLAEMLEALGATALGRKVRTRIKRLGG